MSTSAQLEAIHSMLETGHRSVRLEPHTLPLWGITFGLVIAFIGRFFHPLYSRAFWLGSLAEHVVIVAIVLAVLVVDYRLTRAARRRRDETLSLVQQRVTRMAWLLVGLAVLMSVFGAVQIGGARYVLGLDVVLAGIVLYSVGLFSDSWWRWTGVLLLCLGAIFMLFVPASTTLRWLTACTFAVGFPLIQFLSSWAGSAARRVAAVALVLAAILASGAAATAVHYRTSVSGDGLPTYTLAALAVERPQGEYVVALPAGTQIPIDLRLGGDLFRAPADAAWRMELAQPLHVVLHDGRVTGRYRLGDGPWFQASEALRVKRFLRSTRFEPDTGLSARRELVLGVDPSWGDWLR
jgi:hypothetical protein